MKCSHCGNDLKPGEQFCRSCGNPVSPAPAAPPAGPEVLTATPAVAAAPVPAVGTPPPMPSVATQPSTPIASPAPAAVQSTVVATQPAAMPQATYPNPAMPVNAVQKDGRSKAIAALVLGVLGLIGWLIPIIGLVLGVLALIFGTTSLSSSKRKLAIAGIVLGVITIGLSIFGIVLNAQDGKNKTSYDNAKTTTNTTTQSSSSVVTKQIDTPCYSAEIPSAAVVTQTPGSCTISAADSARGEMILVKVISNSTVTAANLSKAAKADIANVVNAIPGGSITEEMATTFSGSPSYQFKLGASDGSGGVADYVYKKTSQGNIVIVFHTNRLSSKLNDFDVEPMWQWK